MRASLKWLLLAALLITLYSCFGPINRAPEVSLISPRDGAQVAVLASTRSVTLKSTATDPEGRALTFEVYLGTSASNLSKIATVNEPEYTVTNLTPGQTYYWKVVVSDGKNSVESPVWSFTVGGNLATIKVVEFTTGPAAVGVNVEVYQGDTLIISDITDWNGHAKFYLPDGRYDIKITGENKATSVIYNYDPVIIPEIETLSRRAMTDNDKIPNLQITVTAYPDLVLPDPEATTITADYIRLTVESDVVMYVAYIGLGLVPSATGRDAINFDSYEFTTGWLDLRRFNNTTVPLHVVVHTPNDTRVDKIIYLTINRSSVPEVTVRVPPTGLRYTGWTSDVNIAFYSLPRPVKDILFKGMPKEMMNELENYKPEHNIKDTNILVQLAWNHAPATHRAGYNVYRSTDGETWQKIAFTTGNSAFDKSVDLMPGQKYYYTVRTVYRDGTESDNSNIIEVIPLDLFKVKLISPADNETNVSRTPTFVWKPVDWRDWTSTPKIGGDLIDDEDITYAYYGPWIYDTAVSDQHIFYDVLTTTPGPQQVFVTFDPYSSEDWVRIYPDGSLVPQTEPLEKYKTYEWGLDIAAARYVTADGIWFSATIDYGYPGWDRWTNRADYFNRFTTGE
jgi:fibronectin type 3 domain-containing protein